jgi:hypothetical protein
MKFTKTLIVGILIGVAIGWFVGYTRPINKANRDAQQYLKTMENDDVMAAMFAVRAIPLVESGDTKKAIKWLAKPIGSYYRIYAQNAGTNEQRQELRIRIEKLASSNAIVAAELQKQNENQKIDQPAL